MFTNSQDTVSTNRLVLEAEQYRVYHWDNDLETALASLGIVYGILRVQGFCNLLSMISLRSRSGRSGSTKHTSLSELGVCKSAEDAL
jgi:hypothetical protein